MNKESLLSRAVGIATYKEVFEKTATLKIDPKIEIPIPTVVRQLAGVLAGTYAYLAPGTAPVVLNRNERTLDRGGLSRFIKVSSDVVNMVIVPPGIGLTLYLTDQSIGLNNISKEAVTQYVIFCGIMFKTGANMLSYQFFDYMDRRLGLPAAQSVK